MRILFVEPHESSLFSFRKELLDALIEEGHEVILCIELTKKISNEYSDRIKIIDVQMNLKDKGIRSNVKLKNKYRSIIKNEKPDLILSYKIKPNIYCGLCAKKIPMIANITGLGNMFKSNNLLSKLGVLLYRKSFKNVNYIFFQNTDGLNFFKKNKIKINNYKIIPGSGVNTEKFVPTPINKENCTINFLFASRALKEKGFYLLLEAIPIILEKYNNVHFNFLSAEEDIYQSSLAREIVSKYKNNINIIKRIDDMLTVYSSNDFIVSPSFYREGISNVLLESLACGRPIITTLDNPGCMEVLQDNINGYGVMSNDLNSLILALEKAVLTKKDKIENMGLSGRKHVIANFDRKTVIKTYLETIGDLNI